MQNVMQIATNAGHTAQNDGRTAQNDGRTAQNDGRNTLNVCQGPKGGGLRSPQGTPLPLYLKKLYCLEMIKITFFNPSLGRSRMFTQTVSK